MLSIFSGSIKELNNQSADSTLQMISALCYLVMIVNIRIQGNVNNCNIVSIQWRNGQFCIDYNCKLIPIKVSLQKI